MKFEVGILKCVVIPVILKKLDQVKRKLLKLKVKRMLLYLSIYFYCLAAFGTSFWQGVISEIEKKLSRLHTHLLYNNTKAKDLC